MGVNSTNSGIFFGVIVGLFFSFVNGLFEGIIAGIIAGVLFGFLMAYLTKKLKRPQIATDNEILYEGRANHFKGIESVGGWLFLTGKELIFQSHSLNIQRHKLVIPINEIITVKPVKTIGLFSNGLIIITSEQQERFVVNNQKIWVKKIKEIKSAK